MAATFPSTSFPSDIPNLSIQPKTCNSTMSHATCHIKPASTKCEQHLPNVNCLQLQGHLRPALLTTSSQNQLTLLSYLGGRLYTLYNVQWLRFWIENFLFSDRKSACPLNNKNHLQHLPKKLPNLEVVVIMEGSVKLLHLNNSRPKEGQAGFILLGELRKQWI